MAAVAWRTVRPLQAPCKPHGASRPGRQAVRVQAVLMNPHHILGVSAAANIKEVKRAYRKLALQYHPDICKSEDSHEQFIALTQAYEVLLGRADGKSDTNHASSSGWSFHDWYWNFRMNRSWAKQQARSGSAERPAPKQAGFKQQEARENLRSQLAGLRHRAAVRANRPEQQQQAPPPQQQRGRSSCDGDADALVSSSGPSMDPADEQELYRQVYDTAASKFAAGASMELEEDDSTTAAAGSNAASGVAQVGEAVPSHAPAGAGAGGPDMAVCDGHFATVVNNAVPFKRSASPTRQPQAQAEQPGPGPLRYQYQPPQDTAQPQPQPAFPSAAVAAASASHAQDNGGGDSGYAAPDAPDADPESPFSQPYGGTAGQGQGQQYQSQRRRFAANSDAREAVSGQLAGLRRKAAFKSGVAQYV